MDFGELIRWLLLGAFVVVVVYVSARAASFAYFRTKWEYARKRLKELREGDGTNG